MAPFCSTQRRGSCCRPSTVSIRYALLKERSCRCIELRCFSLLWWYLHSKFSIYLFKPYINFGRVFTVCHVAKILAFNLTTILRVIRLTEQQHYVYSLAYSSDGSTFLLYSACSSWINQCFNCSIITLETKWNSAWLFMHSIILCCESWIIRYYFRPSVCQWLQWWLSC